MVSNRSRGAILFCVLLLSSSSILAQDLVLQATFDTDAEGFQYVDDPFRGTDAPAYASGAYLPGGGFAGGGLQVLLGGLDDADILGMSGGWRRDFDLLETGRVTLSFRLNLTQAPDYESDELSEGLVHVDGVQAGGAVAQIIGNGNGGASESTGWQLVEVDLGNLSAGVHTLTIGGYNNKKKTFNNESTEVLLDDIVLNSTPLTDNIALQADFAADQQGFAFIDDAFRGTSAPAYAGGAYLPTGGRQDGGLQVTVGGVDDADILGMSGAWRSSFALAEPGLIRVSFDYNLTQSSEYETDELSQVLLSVDGSLAGPAGSDFVAQIVGDGNGGGAQTTGWRSFSLEIGVLGAGSHDISFGGYNNKKTLGDESTEILIDNVLVTSEPMSDEVIFAAGFDTGADSFNYLDDTFRGTSEPAYATGARLDSGGFQGGALEVVLGGVDDAQILNMSGGWERTFSLAEATIVTLSFRYQLIQSSEYEDDELSQALAALDGGLIGQPPGDVLAQIVGNGNGGGEQSTGWKLFQINLGSLSAGTHTLLVGAFNNKKTFNNETTRVLIDEVLVMRDVPDDPTVGAQAAVDRLDLQRFTDNIATLASFGDRTQGSPSYDTAAAWVQAELEAVGYVVERHAYTFDGEPRDSMYVTKVGTSFPDRMFVVSAHLDGRGGGGAADDDGSGSSLVLEIARILAEADVRTDVSVRMIFWNNEETGLNGSGAYASDRVSLQGIESPPGSGLFPEPTWLGIIQHDMILFDHGLPPQQMQIAGADADIEYQASSTFAEQSLLLANALLAGNGTYATSYPAEVGSNMSNTDSVPFQDFAPSVSVRENERLAEIGNGSNPNWHQPTDVVSTYSAEDFLLGFNILQTTLGTVAELVGLEVGTGAE